MIQRHLAANPDWQAMLNRCIFVSLCVLCVHVCCVCSHGNSVSNQTRELETPKRAYLLSPCLPDAPARTHGHHNVHDGESRAVAYVGSSAEARAGMQSEQTRERLGSKGRFLVCVGGRKVCVCVCVCVCVETHDAAGIYDAKASCC